MERHAWTDERIDDMVERVERRFDAVGRRFDQVDARMDRMDQDLRDLRNEMHVGFVAVRHQMVQMMIAMSGLQMATIVAILVR